MAKVSATERKWQAEIRLKADARRLAARTAWWTARSEQTRHVIIMLSFGVPAIITALYLAFWFGSF